LLASAGFPAQTRHRRTNENCSQPRTEKYIRQAVKFGEHGKNPAAIMKKDLAIFEGHGIRRLYDEKTETWWFSVVDIIRVLTEQPDYKAAQNYWKVLKHRLNKEGSQLVTNCNQLKLEAADGKSYLTDVANAETLLRLVQSVPSPKAEPIKLWLAKVGYERMQEMADPARATWQKHGRSDKWIQQRMTGQEIYWPQVALCLGREVW
jgi:hypothetical protein